MESPGFLCANCEQLQVSVHTLGEHLDAYIGELPDDNVSDANGEEPDDET
ncbi:MAG: hypothetical protein ACXQS1_02105 [Methermicoccaceae archaeon]